MKAKKMKKLLSLMLAMSMVASMPTVALAADEEGGEDTPANVLSDGTTGTGKAEFVYNENVFQVVLPTVPKNDTTLDFILDPMGVIEATQEDEGGNKKVTSEEGSTLYFANVAVGEDGELNTSDDVVTYSKTSDAYEIVNKSTFGIVITVDAVVKGGAAALTVGEDEDAVKANFVEEDDMKKGEDATAAEIYLALTDGTDTAAIALVAGDEGEADDVYKAQLEIEVDAHEQVLSRYDVLYDATTGAYDYNLKPGADGVDADWAASTAKIQMTGACNDYSADWSKLGELAPKVDVTWNVNPEDGMDDYDNKSGAQEKAVGFADATFAKGATGLQKLNLQNLPEGATNAKITVLKYQPAGAASATTMTVSTHYSFANNALTLTAAHIKAVSAKANVVYTGTLTYTLNGKTVTENISFTVTFA